MIETDSVCKNYCGSFDCSSSPVQDDQCHRVSVDVNININGLSSQQAGKLNSANMANQSSTRQDTIQIMTWFCSELNKKDDLIAEKDDQITRLRIELEKQNTEMFSSNKDKDGKIEELKTDLERQRSEIALIVKEHDDEKAQLLYKFESQRTELTLCSKKDEVIAEVMEKNAVLTSLIGEKQEIIKQHERQLQEQKEKLTFSIQKKEDIVVDLQNQLAEMKILVDEKSNVIAALQSQSKEIHERFNEKYSLVKKLEAELMKLNRCTKQPAPAMNDCPSTSELCEEATLSDKLCHLDNDTDSFVDACDSISIISVADIETSAKTSEFNDLLSPAMSEISRPDGFTLSDMNLDMLQTLYIPTCTGTEGKYFPFEDKMLIDEITDSLILNLKIPLPNTRGVVAKKEIIFPSHLIGGVVDQLIENNPTFNVQQLMSRVKKAIQTVTMEFEDDNVVAFWLSNCFELLCVVRAIQDRETSEQFDSRKTGFGMEAINEIYGDLDNLLVEIYNGWVNKLKKQLSEMTIPAVIKHQGLSEYICNQSWGNNVNVTETQFTIEHLTNFLTDLTETMRHYYVEESIRRQLTTELLRVIGVSAFNGLLLRNHFSTWKRGFQIKHNVKQLEKWCVSHDIAEAISHLHQLLHAAELLTLDKTSPKDIQTIFDTCFYLNPTQIKKLLSLYHAEGMDTPLSCESVMIIASTVASNKESDDVLLLDLDQAPDFVKPTPQKPEHVEKFVPDGMDLPFISQVIATV